MAANTQELQALIAKIQADSPQLDNIEISSSTVNSESDLDALCNAIDQNSTLHTVTVTNIFIHPWQAQQLFYAFLRSSSLAVLHMPLYGVVGTPSQKTLMRLEEDFDTSLQAHNNQRDQDLKSIICLVLGLRKGFTIAQPMLSQYSQFKRQKVEVQQKVILPLPALERIYEYCVEARKKITL